MDLLLVAVVASVAIISVSITTFKSIKLVLTNDINLSQKIKFENEQN